MQNQYNINKHPFFAQLFLYIGHVKAECPITIEKFILEMCVTLKNAQLTR